MRMYCKQALCYQKLLTIYLWQLIKIVLDLVLHYVLVIYLVVYVIMEFDICAIFKTLLSSTFMLLSQLFRKLIIVKYTTGSLCFDVQPSEG